MNIKTLIQTGRRYGRPMLALLCAGVISACGITGPEDTPWDDVRAFAWPVDTTLAYTKYSFEDNPDVPDTTSMNIRIRLSNSDVYWNGERFFERKSEFDNARRLFLAMKDTLVTRQGEFPSDLALVAPLEKGHTWICGSSRTSIPWRATILERYSYRKIEGVTYKNVIEVEYRPTERVGNEPMAIWTLFYAEGKGVVQTLESSVLRPVAANEPPPPPKPVSKTVLVGAQDALSKF